jgi:hypothetical protein
MPEPDTLEKQESGSQDRSLLDKIMGNDTQLLPREMTISRASALNPFSTVSEGVRKSMMGRLETKIADPNTSAAEKTRSEETLQQLRDSFTSTPSMTAPSAASDRFVLQGGDQRVEVAAPSSIFGRK